MALSDDIADARSFLDYYVLGASASNAAKDFPGSSFPGIVLRRPAVLGIRPEYTPQAHPNDNTVVSPRSPGQDPTIIEPEGPGDYLFLDRCAVRRALVVDGGGFMLVRFLFVPVYPAGTFLDIHQSVIGRSSPGTTPVATEVRLPASLCELDLTARECLFQLEDYMGNNPANNLNCSVEVLTLQQFNALPDAG